MVIIVSSMLLLGLLCGHYKVSIDGEVGSPPFSGDCSRLFPVLLSFDRVCWAPWFQG